MFDSLSQRLQSISRALGRRGVLTEADVDKAVRDIRVALLEADVSLSTVKDLIASVKAQAVGQSVVASVAPGQMVVKIVNSALVDALGGDSDDATLNVNHSPPATILMVGLQGAGKTTMSAKVAKRLSGRKKVFLASLDVYRPAAQRQLALLAERAGIDHLPVVDGETPVEIAKRAVSRSRSGGYDVVILDSAGRMHIDQDMMDEIAQVRDAAPPSETLLVVDALIGQEAATLAREFDHRIGVSGIALTRMDSDTKGGAALSMRAAIGKPIKLLGVGEGLDALETFHPHRLADRILGMGDIVSLVEKAAAAMDEDKAEKMAARLSQGHFDLNDFLSQLRQIRKMGDLKGVFGLLPGISKIKKQINQAQLDDAMLTRQEAIILSMTPTERRNPNLVKASRKRRIAAGSGTAVSEVNKLLQQHRQMSSTIKKLKKMGGSGGLAAGVASLFGGGASAASLVGSNAPARATDRRGTPRR